MSVMKILTYIITGITAKSIRLAAILAVMCILTFTPTGILHVYVIKKNYLNVQHFEMMINYDCKLYSWLS